MIGYDPDAIVRHYFSDQEGELFLVSRDDFFVKSVRSVFQKTLGIKEIEVEQHRNLQSGLRSILDRTRNGVAVMVMVERYLEKVSSADFVRALSGAAPSAKIMCLTDEAERGVSAFMHELGAGSILTKPASANDIIAKTAGLVKPLEKLMKLLAEAKRLLNRRCFEEAIALCQKVMAIKPDSAGMLMIKGESLIGLGRFEEGVACLEAAHASAPLYLDPLERLVRAYVGRDDGKRLHWLEVLDNISPRNLRRKYDVGRLHQRLGNQEEGERRFSEAMTLARTESPHIFSQVAVDIAEVVVDQSLPLAESFLIEAMNSREGKFGPDDMMLFNRLGLNLRRQGKWKDAEACYVRALTISPKDEGLHYNLGMVLAEAGDLHGALARFDKALALNPNLGSDSKTVSVNMGHVYLQAGLHERAVVFFEQALALTPNDNAILRALQHARQAA